MMEEDKKKLLEEFEKRMHATLVATSTGCPLAEFCKNFDNDWGTKKTVMWYTEQTGFQNVMEMIKSMPDKVTVIGNILKAVPKEETRDVQDLIDRSQANKLANQKKKKANTMPSAWIMNTPGCSTASPLFMNLSPAPSGFQMPATTGFTRLCVAPSASFDLPPDFNTPNFNFIRPPIGDTSKGSFTNSGFTAWSSNCNNWPSAVKSTTDIPPGYFGLSVPRTVYPQWSTINNGCDTTRRCFGGSRPAELSNVSALPKGSSRSTSSGLYSMNSTARQLHSSSYDKTYFFSQSNQCENRTVRNHFDGQTDDFGMPIKVESSPPGFSVSSIPIRSTPQGFTLDEVEEGEIVEGEDHCNSENIGEIKNKSKSAVSTSAGERTTQLTVAMTSSMISEQDFGYNSTDEADECNTFMANYNVKRVPPYLHRIVSILKSAGGRMLYKDMQAQYEKKYLTKLTSIELRKILGTPEARNTLVAFRMSPFSYIFHYELTMAGNGIVKLIIDPDDFTQIANTEKFNGADVSTSAQLIEDMSAMSIDTLVERSRTSVTRKLSVVDVEPSLDEIPLPSNKISAGAAITKFSDIPLPSGTPNHPLVTNSKSDRSEPVSNNLSSLRALSQSAKDFLALATTAYDLTSKKRTLQELFGELRGHSAYREFTSSPAQLIGLLMMYFEKCFQIFHSEDDGRQHIYITSTTVKPSVMIDSLRNFPMLLYTFPSVADSLVINESVYAYIFSHKLNDEGNLQFVVQLVEHEKTRISLMEFLTAHDKILDEMEVKPLAVSSLAYGQCVLYRSVKYTRRCRVIRTGTSLQEIRLQCMDRGRVYEDLQENTIFEFPAASNTEERYPALAVYCEFADNNCINLKSTQALFSKLRARGSAVMIKLLASSQFSDFDFLFKVELLVRQNGDEFLPYPHAK